MAKTRLLSRDRFRQMFAERWESSKQPAVGQHVALIGPTGRGKSTIAKQILADRNGRTVLLAPKGVDETLAGFGHKISKWPPNPLTTPRPKNGRWILRLEPPVKKYRDLPEMREQFAKSLDTVFEKGSWTVYVDELQVLADPRMMGLGKPLETMLVMGRSRKISVVSSFQAARWIPRAAYDQASHVLLWRQRDRQALKRISEISGVDSAEIEGLVKGLEFHEFVWVDARADEYFVVAPK